MSVNRILVAALVGSLLLLGAAARAQDVRRGTERRAALDGVYRIDIGASDRLYTVVAGASSNLPFGEQQRFFIDLAVRLTPPDLLAIERRGASVTIGSSRAPRVTLTADGVARTERAADGRVVRSRVALEGERLVFTSSGRTEDNFSVIFTPFDNGRRLRVTRRLSAEQLNEPVIIQTVYNKISDRPRWDIYGETLLAQSNDEAEADERPADGDASTRAPRPAARTEGFEARALRASLARWVEATNARDIEQQMGFYMPRLKAFYLTRDAARAAVRAEKSRAFASASLIDIRAEEPEIVFADAGRTAVMRFRKRYRIDDGPRSRRGEVVQELRWQLTPQGWRIFSERDVRVIR